MTDTGPGMETPRGGESEGTENPAAGSSTRAGSFAKNVVSNWAGHLLFIVSGFILPRLINDHLGQERLGVWDFGWSTVSYLNLLTAGIASSVNRYVAKYKATAEWAELRSTVSSCACIFGAAALMGCAISCALVVLLPKILPYSFAPYVREAQWLLLCLGLAASFDLFVPTYVGVLSGSQRYDLLAAIESACHIATLGWIALLLWSGHGLAVMGVPVLGMKIVEGLLKRAKANKLLPELRLSVGEVSRERLRAVFVFGVKTLLESLARMALYQGNNLLVAVFLGPSAVAVYSRSMALILHANKVMFHFGRILAPSASDLQARKDAAALRTLVLRGTSLSVLIALPMALVLAIDGGALLRIWMGKDYASNPVLPILAIGHLASQSQVGSFYALMGLNRHGRASIAILVAALVSVAVSAFFLKVLGWGLPGVACSVALSVTIPYVFVVPVATTRAVGLSVSRYFWETVPKALAVCIPFGACLLAARIWFSPNDLSVLSAGLGTGGVVLACCYWRWVLPTDLRSLLARKLRWAGGMIR